MNIELPPDGLGKRPHATAAVPREPFDLTDDEERALAPIVKRMRERVMGEVGGTGFNCPACAKLVHIYLSAPSYAAMRLMLLLYCEYGSVKPFHLRNDGQLIWGRKVLPVEVWMLSPWGLIEPHVEIGTIEWDDGTLHDADIEVPGEYYFTAYGERFFTGDLQIPSHAATYDRRVLWLDDTVGFSIYQAVGREFDLEELIDAPHSDRMRILMSGAVVSRPRRGRR